MKEETKKWLDKAEKDLDDGVFNFENGREEVAAFLFHQAVEKALKAFQIESREEHDYSHDLLSLSDGTAKNKYKKLMKELNPVYTGFRYPDVGLKKIENLEEIRYKTEELLEWTRKRLKK